MLTLRPNCEHCKKDLPYDAPDAMICSFECTFCQQCVHSVLKNVCPNCGGGFTARPIRLEPVWSGLVRYPASTRRIVKPINIEDYEKLYRRYKSISPKNR